MSQETATAIQAVAALAQCALAGALIWVTWCYTKETRRIARETSDMAAATQRAVTQAQEQHLDASMPVVVFRSHSPMAGTDGYRFGFQIQVSNIGHGPALNVLLKLQNASGEFTFDWSRSSRQHFPVVLGSNESIDQGFQSVDLTFTCTVFASYSDIHARSYESTASLNTGISTLVGTTDQVTHTQLQETEFRRLTETRPSAITSQS